MLILATSHCGLGSNDYKRISGQRCSVAGIFSNYQGKSGQRLSVTIISTTTNANPVNPKRPRRFCNFPKKWIKKFESSISTTTLTRETIYSAFERSGIELSFWSGEPLSPRAPSRTLVSFSVVFVRPAARGLVVTPDYYWDLLRKNLMCKCVGLVFGMGQDFFEKTGFRQKVKFGKKNIFRAKQLIFLFWRLFHFFYCLCHSNQSRYQGIVGKNCAREYGLLAKWNEIEKRYVTLKYRWVV